MTSGLPKCVSLMSGYNGAMFLYLGAESAKRHDGILTFGQLGYDEPLTSSTHARFYLDPSKHKDDELWHVRCAYNNKYLMPIAQASSGLLLVGTADEPEENLYKSTCTLLKLTILSSYEEPKAKSTVYHVRSCAIVASAPSSSCAAALALLSLRSPSRLLAAVAAKEPELGGDGSEGSGGAGSGSGGAAAVSTRREPARSAPRASQVPPPPPPATVASPAPYRRGSSRHLPQQRRPRPAPPPL
ncbi:uncharacterized protein [Triticum aestivum]|uniref:uncharacterized protein n=1 Tax=Triticum aestivum TaxID=4565 RepID=UPI001D017669|nr:uncharacterized protein LOC123097234 [Triticum aestivum]